MLPRLNLHVLQRGALQLRLEGAHCLLVHEEQMVGEAVVPGKPDLAHGHVTVVGKVAVLDDSARAREAGVDDPPPIPPPAPLVPSCQSEATLTRP